MEILLINTTIDKAFNIDTSKVLKYTICTIPLVLLYKTRLQDLMDTGEISEQTITGQIRIDICLN